MVTMLLVRRFLLGCAAFAVALLVLAPSAAACPLYKQCDSQWGNEKLGSGPDTICAAGCAMTSVAMALSCRGASINPGSLDEWLDSHGGFSGELIIWSAANAFGVISFAGEGQYSFSDLSAAVSRGNMVILNVRGGSHWVLATGVSGSGFNVNDPGFPTSYYDYSGVGTAVIYN